MASWGYSQLADYAKCPYRFFLLRIEKRRPKRDGRNAYIGWVLGWLVESFYEHRWYREPDILEARMLAALPGIGGLVTKRERLVWDPGEEAKWLAVAAAAVPKIIETIKRERLLGELVGHEYDVVIQIREDRVFGRIDLLIYDPRTNRLIVVDLKAGGTVGKWVDANQLRLYTLGVLADPRFRRLPTHVGFWWLRHGLVKWRKPFTPKVLAVFAGEVEQTIANVKAKHFEAKPSGYCRLCDFLPECGPGQARMYHAKDVGLPTNVNHGVIEL